MFDLHCTCTLVYSTIHCTQLGRLCTPMYSVLCVHVLAGSPGSVDEEAEGSTQTGGYGAIASSSHTGQGQSGIPDYVKKMIKL